MISSFESILARDGKLVYKTHGVSMEPMLRQNRDLVIIEVPASRLKKYDVALYKRGKQYVLHRVIDARDGYYLIRGDNTYVLERVPDAAVLGVLTGFKRKGRDWSVNDPAYVRYVRFWCAIYPARAVFARLYRWARAVARRLGLKKWLRPGKKEA